MHGAAPTDWQRYVFPRGRRISARFEGDVRGQGNFYVPSMRVEARETGYEITVRAPGAERDELTVALHGALLRVTGERRGERCRNEHGSHEHAQYISCFTRETRLERAVDVDHAEARFENGVLTVRLPFVAMRQEQEDETTLIDIH